MPDPTIETVSARSLQTAYDTLVRASAFVAARAERGRDAAEDGRTADPVRVRLLGNRLRELDRFLNLLTDEAALALDAPGHDGPAFARRRNTANKLRAVRGMMRLGCPDHERLRAIGRLSACLHHCAGRAHAPGLWDDLALSGPGPHAARGATLELTPRTVGQICRFYRATADALMREVGGRTPLSLTF